MWNRNDTNWKQCIFIEKLEKIIFLKHIGAQNQINQSFYYSFKLIKILKVRNFTLHKRIYNLKYLVTQNVI